VGSNTIFYLALPARTALKGGVLDPVANKKGKLFILTNHLKFIIMSCFVTHFAFRNLIKVGVIYYECIS
jgi:hypothetical protein